MSSFFEITHYEIIQHFRWGKILKGNHPNNNFNSHNHHLMPVISLTSTLALIVSQVPPLAPFYILSPL